MSTHFKILLSFIFILCTTGVHVFAQKTDKVILKNGDIITGEVRKLDLDILQYKTSTMSTAQIKWHHVSSIISPDKDFQIELNDGTKIFGHLDTARIPNTLKIIGEKGEFNISIGQVVKIIQVKQLFWNKFSGNVDVGINFTKASNVFQRNYGGKLEYTAEKYFSKIEFSSLQTTQQDSIYTAKQDLSIDAARSIGKKEFVTIFGGAQQNTELGIDIRSSIGAGYGIDLLHTGVARIRTVGGLTANREKAAGDAPVTDNVEGLIKLETKIFKYTDPEVHLNAFVNWYPSLTVAGRHRFEAELQFRVELLNNFFIELRLYTNNDNKPISEDASHNDWGIISSLSYTFGL